MPKSDFYWGAEPLSTDVVKACINRIRRYREHLRVTGRTDRMRRTWSCYRGYGPRGDTDASRFNPGGEQGEIIHTTVNHFASLVNQAVVLTTSNKPATNAIPENMDYESLAQAQFAESLNDHYDRELGISDREDEATLTMVMMGESWVVAEWDPTAGEAYMDGSAPQEDGAAPVPPPPGQNSSVIHTGEPRLFALTPFDVAIDPDVANIDSHTWLLWRRRTNRYDLAALHPEHADRLRAENSIDSALSIFDTRDESSELIKRRTTNAESDDVWVWELRHKSSPACPNGRMVRFVNADMVLFDSVAQTPEGVADYGSVYLDDLFAWAGTPERLPGSNEPHTAFFDLLGLQEGVDLSATIMASAINAGGMQNLYVPRGANVTADKLTGSLNVIEYDGQVMPRAEANVSIPPEVAQWAELCVSWMRQRVSLNDVVVGEPSKGMPAQAMALLRAQAVEFHSKLQKAYEKLITKTRTGILKLLQRFATMERLVMISGHNNAWASKTFKNSQVSKVKGFVVEPINPVMKTLAGKVAFAQPLLDRGDITTQQYLDVVRTGRLEPILRGEQENMARIQREKELLMKGVGMPPVQALPPGAIPPPGALPQFIDDGQQHIRPLITDTHWLDIPEYLSVLAMPSVRDNAQVVSAVLDLVDFKLKLWRQMDPAIIVLLRGVMPPPMGAPVVVPGAPQPPDSPTPALGGPNGAPQAPNLPQPPKNPITGNNQDLNTALRPAPPPGL